MTLKKYSDHARAFTFKRDFETMDHANVTSTDILSYMRNVLKRQHFSVQNSLRVIQFKYKKC